MQPQRKAAPAMQRDYDAVYKGPQGIDYSLEQLRTQSRKISSILSKTDVNALNAEQESALADDVYKAFQMARTIVADPEVLDSQDKAARRIATDLANQLREKSLDRMLPRPDDKDISSQMAARWLFNGSTDPANQLRKKNLDRALPRPDDKNIPSQMAKGWLYNNYPRLN